MVPPRGRREGSPSSMPQSPRSPPRESLPETGTTRWSGSDRGREEDRSQATPPSRLSPSYRALLLSPRLLTTSQPTSMRSSRLYRLLGLLGSNTQLTVCAHGLNIRRARQHSADDRNHGRSSHCTCNPDHPEPPPTHEADDTHGSASSTAAPCRSTTRPA